ncbi:MAG: hypothetical protein F6K00_22675 [Leptolyngbya sp. SIOISBB]|nr:hypothetical protein [Leptolyngbya sp. SIOISBB]
MTAKKHREMAHLRRLKSLAVSFCHYQKTSRCSLLERVLKNIFVIENTVLKDSKGPIFSDFNLSRLGDEKLPIDAVMTAFGIAPCWSDKLIF